MTPERWQQIESLFHAACARAPEERAAFLDQACAGDAELRREVESLLALAPLAQTAMVQPAVPPAADGLNASTGAPTAGHLSVGTLLERKYRIEGVLGSGGMGAVYRARHLQLQREVALKVIRAGLLADRSASERFRREAVAVARLRHPSIVTVHDYGVAEGVGAYLVMELLEGRSLRQELAARGRLAEREALGLIGQVCAGVAAAHEAGVVHRDLKPENIFLEHRAGAVVVKVLDFGLAKLEEAVVTGGAGLTQRGVVMGTPAYMAPEQCRGEAADARTDVYALGGIFYELLTGQPPFTGSGAAALLYRHVHEAPRPPSELVGGLSPGVEAALLRALAKAPEERHQTVEAFGGALGVWGGAAEPVTLAPGGATGAGKRATAAVRDTGAGPTRTNLPQAMTRFIGREAQIDALRQELGRERLVTLTGAGGIGKTRLALEVAREALEDFPDGVWLVELASLADGALVAKAVAAAVGVREEPGSTVEETLAAWLRDRQALLVLDNCEHLVEACARLAQGLVRACPQVRVLATSREALGVAGEAVRSVGALEVPTSGASAEEVLASEAVRLFADRAALSKAGFTAGEANAEAIAAVCRRLEGIPLAIELAAARVKVLSVEQILARLEDRFRLLTSGSRAGPSRQQTLRATLDWSYELLTEQERVLLRRLSIFAGGWRLEAAEGVCTGGGIDAMAVLEVLSRLVDKSLVVVDEKELTARYGILETVCEYARERLDESEEAEAVARRHAEFFLDLAEEATPQLFGEQAAQWLARLEAEHDNLWVALRWLLEHDADACLRLAKAVCQLWLRHGPYTEGRQWLEVALERSRTAPARVRATALGGAGDLARVQGDLAAARGYYEERLRLGREAGDAREIGWASYSLGVVAAQQGDLQAARACVEETLARGREVSNDGLIGGAINSLGEFARAEGEWAAARQLYEQAVALFKKAPDWASVSTALTNLGAVACEAGDLEDARVSYREALRIDQALGDREGIGYALDGLAAVAAKRAAWARAGRLAGIAQALLEAMGHELEPVDRAFRERYLAEARAALGEPQLEEAMAEGRTLTLEQAIRYALEDTPEE